MLMGTLTLSCRERMRVSPYASGVPGLHCGAGCLRPLALDTQWTLPRLETWRYRAIDAVRETRYQGANLTVCVIQRVRPW